MRKLLASRSAAARWQCRRSQPPRASISTALSPAGGGDGHRPHHPDVRPLTILSVAPGLLIMVTSFTRFVIAFSILRAGIGLQTTPANLILISLSLFMTFYVMAPTFDQAWHNGVKPLMRQPDHRRRKRIERITAAVPRLHAAQRARQGFRAVRRSRAASAARPRLADEKSTCASWSRPS